MDSATRVMISTFGGFAGLMGIEHGIGEVLQGNVPPNGLMILSWPDSDFLRILGGEPAMTIVPDMFVTGILAILFSLVYVLWAVVWVERKHSGYVLMGISVPMLLFGGGIFPPVLGFLLGAAATGLHSPLTWWQKRLSRRAGRFLGRVWPWAFAACLLCWLAMFPGVPVMEYFFGMEDATVIFSILGGMFVFLFLSIIAGFARDAQKA